MRKGGLEPKAEAENVSSFAGRCRAVCRRIAPFGPQGAKLEWGRERTLHPQRAGLPSSTSHTKLIRGTMCSVRDSRSNLQPAIPLDRPDRRKPNWKILRERERKG